MAPPRQPPELIDDAVAEILLRIPPDEPADLFRASLVCKLWLRIAQHVVADKQDIKTCACSLRYG